MGLMGLSIGVMGHTYKSTEHPSRPPTSCLSRSGSPGGRFYF